MSKPARVLILGYGEMGHAMEFLLRDTHELSIWDGHPAPGFLSDRLELAAPEADIVLFCLPASPHREIAQQLAPLLRPGCVCVSIAKGLDDHGETAAQVFADILGAEGQYALLYGPMISEEIRAGRYAFAQLGCTETATYDAVRNIFAGTRLFTEHTTEIEGISWSVILKNVYAIMFGVADELGLGDNMRGYLMVAATRELDRIVRHKGGGAGVPYDVAGLGDLVTTATSEDSHHHELGRMLARAETDNISGEGIHTLAMVEKYDIIDTGRFPLFGLTGQIVSQPADARQLIKNYLNKQYQ